VIDPSLDGMLVKPESNTSAIGKGFVILRPVADAVLLFLLSHKLNIPVSPHPSLFMQQRRFMVIDTQLY
jgi:hypothetical protein